MDCADKLDVVLDCAAVKCNFGWRDWKLSLCTWLISEGNVAEVRRWGR